MMESQRLLVIDDSPTVRKLVELTFRGSPWVVDYATTGGEGLASARRTPPDAILLDFVLPDMRGLDVCERLSKDESTASIPIVVMSAKDSAAQIFKSHQAVKACLAKPSTTERIRAEVEGAAARVAKKPSASNGASFAKKEAAAKALYALLRDGLARIPVWMKELGDSPPAAFFARKLLTPQLVSGLLEAMIPHVRALLPAASEAASASAEASEGSFQGKVDGWPVATLITFFECSARTGMLTLNTDGKETLAYVRGGEVIAVTNRDAAEYLRGQQRARLKTVPADVMEAAAAEQRRTGTPVLFTFAAGGYFPADALTEALASRGRRLLMAAMAATKATFSWRDLDSLPAYVEAHGRHISTSRNTLRFGAEEVPTGVASPPQRKLQELRKTGDEHKVAAHAIFARNRGFSDLVRQYSLSATERQVLALVDGRADPPAIAAASGLEIDEVTRVLGCLVGVELVCEVSTSDGRDPSNEQVSRPVMILEPDVQGFQQPLASLLQSRAQPIRLIDLAGEQDLVAAIRRERPRAVFLNPAAAPIDGALKDLRSRPELSDVALVVVLDPDRAREVKQFSDAGFETVLVKPIARLDIERLVS